VIENVPLKPTDISNPPTEAMKSFGHPSLHRMAGSAEKAKKGEDSMLVNHEIGTYGVFDGVGGHGDGKRASQMTAEVFTRYFNELPTDVESCKDRLKEAFFEANRIVAAPDQTMTTATVLQFVTTTEGETHAVWGSVGDSRLYIHRDDEVTVLTLDEGEGKFIYNAIGIGEHFYLKQLSSIKVKPGDKFMVCSDGITGDTDEESLSERELESAFNKTSSQESADEFLRISKKNDDKSVAVVIVEELKTIEKTAEALFDLGPHEVKNLNTELPLEDRGSYKITAEINAGGGEDARLLVLDIRYAPLVGKYKLPFGDEGPAYDADFLVVDASFFKSDREGDVKDETGFKGIRPDAKEVPFGRNHQAGRFAFPRTVSGDHFSITFDGVDLKIINKDPLNGTRITMNR